MSAYRSVQEYGVLRTTRPDRLGRIPCGRRRDRSRPLFIDGWWEDGCRGGAAFRGLVVDERDTSAVGGRRFDNGCRAGPRHYDPFMTYLAPDGWVILLSFIEPTIIPSVIIIKILA